MSERKRGHPAGKTGKSLLAPGWQDRAKKTMVYGLLSDAWDAYTAPQRAYRGLLDPMSDEAIKNMADLGGMVTLGAGAVPAQKNTLRAGIKAYHGSPHDFDKFSMGKIGTGEGAQAYGHGLYFTETEDIAKVYRNAVSAQHMGRATNWDDPNSIAEYWSGIYGGKEGGIKHLESVLRDAARYPNNFPDGEVEKITKSLEYLKSGAPLPQRGKMYEVNINANPDDFLDYDRPLVDQGAGAQAALAKLGYKADPQGLQAYDDALLNDLMGDGDAASLPKQPRNPTGSDVLTQLGETRLREAGIPGIKYLDQGSRAAGDGSRNYVVFDENLIEIVRKYGIAGALAAGLLTQEQAKQFTQQQGPSQGEWEAAYKQGRGA